MSRLNIARNLLRRAAHRVHVRLGANGLAGAGLAVLAVVGATYAYQAQQETVRLQAELDQARVRATQRSALPAVDAFAPAERLSRFQNWFPTLDTSPDDLRKIFHAAQQSHVVLAKGEYNLTNIDGSGGLQKYDVILPVKENYSAVKGFVAQVLNELPHASLAELRVERPAAGADELDTRVHFTLYYRTRTT
jgi:hypothetical protein